MIKYFDFIPVTQELPTINKPVLIKYSKGKKSNWNGQTGIFYTQGYYQEECANDGCRRIWYDYTDRQLQNLDANASKNKILEWAYFQD